MMRHVCLVGREYLEGRLSPSRLEEGEVSSLYTEVCIIFPHSYPNFCSFDEYVKRSSKCKMQKI